MAFLSSVVGYIVTAILSAIGGWLLKVFHSWYTNIKQDKEAKQSSEQSVDALKRAGENDADAIDKATDSALGGL